MKQETKDTANISLVALIIVLVIASVITCSILIATPFLVKWIVGLLLVLGKSIIVVF